MFGSITDSEFNRREKVERLRIRDLEIEIGDAKLIKADVDKVVCEAKQRLMAFAIALHIKTGADVGDFEEIISDRFYDMLSDTFSGVVSEMESRL